MPERARGRRPAAPLTGARVERRQFLAGLAAGALAGVLPRTANAAAAALTAARLWPAREYTRLTLESTAPLRYRLAGGKGPEPLWLQLDDVVAGDALSALPARVGSEDPHVRALHVIAVAAARVRVEIDVKVDVEPQVFALAPVGDYGHRLVIDLYPAQAYDPLLAFLEQLEKGGTAPAPGAAEPGRGPAPARRVVVAVDPGHGGEDPGAIGRRGTYEKHVTLAIARRLKRLLDRESGVRVLLTRDDDYFVPLATRVQRARAARADLFISIHADAFEQPQVQGSSVFALSENGATSAAARWLAKRENAADLIGGVNIPTRDPVLAQTLLSLSQAATIADSLKLGKIVLDQLGEVNTLRKTYVEQAGFAVLKAPDVPSILVETAFISNPQEELKLRDERHQQRIAGSILDGVRRYLATNPPLARL